MFPTAYKPAAVPQDYQGFSVADNQIKNKIILLLLFCSKLILCGYMIIIFTEIVINTRLTYKQCPLINLWSNLPLLHNQYVLHLIFLVWVKHFLVVTVPTEKTRKTTIFINYPSRSLTPITNTNLRNPTKPLREIIQTTWSWYPAPQTKPNLWLSLSVKQHWNPCSRSPPVYQDLSMCHDWPVKKAIINCQSCWRELKFKMLPVCSLLEAQGFQ